MKVQAEVPITAGKNIVKIQAQVEKSENWMLKPKRKNWHGKIQAESNKCGRKKVWH